MAGENKIEKEPMPIAWHPSRYWNLCMTEDEEKSQESYWMMEIVYKNSIKSWWKCLVFVGNSTFLTHKILLINW